MMKLKPTVIMFLRFVAVMIDSFIVACVTFPLLHVARDNFAFVSAVVVCTVNIFSIIAILFGPRLSSRASYVLHPVAIIGNVLLLVIVLVGGGLMFAMLGDAPPDEAWTNAMGMLIACGVILANIVLNVYILLHDFTPWPKIGLPLSRK